MRSLIVSARPEMVDFGSGQGRRALGTAGLARRRRGFQKRENAGLGRKMPFMDGHELNPLAILSAFG